MNKGAISSREAVMRLTRLFYLHQLFIAFPICIALDPAAVSAAFSDSLSIAKFLGERDGAISYTFDDGTRDQMQNAPPLLEAQGFRGTFFVIAGLAPQTDEQAASTPSGSWGSGSWQSYARVAASGHEIGNHSWSHVNLVGIDDNWLHLETTTACSLIAVRIGTPAFSYAYPYNTWDAKVRAAVFLRHHAAREAQTGIGTSSTLTSCNSVANNAITTKTWVALMIHGIAAGYDSFSNISIFRDHLAYVKTKDPQLWVATFGAVSRYSKERDFSTIIAQRTGVNEATVRVSTTLDTSLYDQPLTVIIPAAGAVGVTARRQTDNQAVPASIKTGRILVDIVPDNSPVIVTWTFQSSIMKSGGPKSGKPARIRGKFIRGMHSSMGNPNAKKAFDAQGRERDAAGRSPSPPSIIAPEH
jgi:peptidoglycan/xylan/chitin deacetylase (PgdA/CDA1 family)